MSCGLRLKFWLVSGVLGAALVWCPIVAGVTLEVPPPSAGVMRSSNLFHLLNPIPSQQDSLPLELEELRQQHETPEDYFQRQLEAAKQGDPAAQWRLAQAYEQGYGTAINVAEAAKWLRLAANQGHGPAMNDRGVELLRSTDAQAWDEAARLFNAASAWGQVEPTYNQALTHFLGRGAPKDSVKGMVLLEIAAERGLVIAQYELGVRYYLGLGTAKDGAKATLWLERAQAKGHGWALYFLAVLYFQGELVPKDIVKGMKLLQDGINRDQPEAQYLKGHMLIEGWKVPKDAAVGLRWMKQAADSGLPLAQA
jgi:hypothetical protein